jgi:hypothetical protein
MAFAPTNCSFVQVSEDGSVKWVKLRYPVDDPNMTLQGRMYPRTPTAHT